MAQAQSGDWARLKSTKRGTKLVIETNVNAYGPADFDRCKLLRVDASTLTCMALDGKTRLTFSANSLDAVYKVKRAWIAPTVAASVLGGLIIGGLASGNAGAAAIGIFGFVIWGYVLMVGDVNHQIDVWTGAFPDPLPRNEHRELLYLRP